LCETTRKNERDAIDQWKLTWENKKRAAKGLKPLKKLESSNDDDTDASDKEEEENDEDNDEIDPILMESSQILVDYIQIIEKTIAKKQ
jgi:TATA-binding protein-associated factor Taf7